MAPEAGLMPTWHSVDRHREYGSHHIETVYATGNARVFLGNAERIGLGDKSGDPAQRLDNEKVLLKALYYDLMNRRRNQIPAAAEETCDWIWTSDFRIFLADPSIKVFWIVGKPGSGKSILMKYLASSFAELKQILPSTWKYGNSVDAVEIRWRTVDFFFDFRLMTKLGNSLEGLLRTLLHQLVGILPGLVINFPPSLTQYEDFSLDQLKATLDKALISLKNNTTHVLMLVDGVDEFAGRKKSILDFLLLLSEHENVKLCLASRPESMIREKLAHVQSLSVSNHNQSGLRRFIQDATSEFQPRLDALRLSNIESLILTRSCGVFLWVYYAVEALLQSYAEGATVGEIEAILSDIPDELEVIYERIVHDIPINRRPEAAILYVLISGADFDVSLELLQSTLYMLISHFEMGLEDIEDINHFSRRLHTTMGGLVDIISGSEDTRLHESTHVRLMHETVKSFIVKSQWVESYLPADLSRYAANELWFYLGIQALFAVNLSESALITGQLTELTKTGSNKGCLHDSGDTTNTNITIPILFAESIAKGLKTALFQKTHSNLGRLAHILCYSIIFVPPLCARKMKSRLMADELRSTCGKILKSKLVVWHFVLAKSLSNYSSSSAQLYDIAGSSPLPMDHEIQDLLLASAYRIYDYLEENMHSIATLDDQQRDEIVGTMMASSFRWPRSGSREWIKEKGTDISVVPGLIDRIIAYSTKPSTFHLAVYFVLGYDDLPQCIKQSKDGLGRMKSFDWSTFDLPKWVNSFEATDSGRLLRWFPLGDPLEVWEAAFQLHGQRRLAEYQLSLLNSLGITFANDAHGQFLRSVRPEGSVKIMEKKIHQLETEDVLLPSEPTTSAADPFIHAITEDHQLQQILRSDGAFPKWSIDELMAYMGNRVSSSSEERPRSLHDNRELLHLIGSQFRDLAAPSGTCWPFDSEDTKTMNHEMMVQIPLEVLLQLLRQSNTQLLDPVLELLRYIPDEVAWNHCLAGAVKRSPVSNQWPEVSLQNRSYSHLSVHTSRPSRSYDVHHSHRYLMSENSWKTL